MNEATTRAHFLNPLLEALGYRSIDDVLFEYYLPDGKTFLDYRLVVDGKPRVAVEAKALSVSLTDKDAAQVVAYGSILGDEWAVVTNAREWRLYHTFVQAGLQEKRMLTVDLIGWESDAQFDNVFEQLWLISKESFTTGEGPATWLTSQKLDHTMRSALTDPASPEIKYIRKQLESRGVSVAADQVVSWFRTRLETGPATTPLHRRAIPAAYPSPQSKSLVAAHESPTAPVARAKGIPPGPPQHWLIPAGTRSGYSSAEHLRMWLDKGFWGFGESTPGRKAIHQGDWACFYAAKAQEILAYARGRRGGKRPGHRGRMAGGRMPRSTRPTRCHCMTSSGSRRRSG